jgi:hypothetical protein
MRVAETRAVNRALRKAYGIGLCSVEEIGSAVEPQFSQESKKLPPQSANGNYGGPRVRDRLCQIIRQHQLDATLVKSYATDFCGVKSLLRRLASRLRASSLTWPTGPRKTAMLYCASSTATYPAERTRKVPHETPNPRLE